LSLFSFRRLPLRPEPILQALRRGGKLRSAPDRSNHDAKSLPPFDQSPWPESLAKWAIAWDLPGLESRVRLLPSSRMRVSLGRYFPRSREIRIADFLFDAPRSLLHEVVCHEFAHAAVDERFGLDCRPHGEEWRALMRQVGHDPRARIPGAELERLVPIGRSRRVSWRHRCPICQAQRLAGRPVASWRCVACVSVGSSGRLEVERLESGEK
jgi:predicted SprT family Zn-dependent metalloprotease